MNNAQPIQRQLCFQNQKIHSKTETIMPKRWTAPAKDIEASLRAAGILPGYGWEEGMFDAITRGCSPMLQVLYNIVCVTPKELRCPYGTHERAQEVMEYAMGSDLYPVHPLIALAYIIMLRQERPAECRGLMVLCTGTMMLQTESGRPFLLTVNHTSQRGWLSPLFMDGFHGATPYQSTWVFSTQ